jgi:hypothetical protein
VGGELKKPNTLSVGLRAFRPYSAVNCPVVGGKRLGKWSDPYDLGSELSLLPNSQPYATRWHLSEAKATHRL